MELKKFTAPTMAEALTQVKAELGPTAVILSTRTVQQRRLMGLVKKDHVEITAGRNVRTVPRRPASRPAPPRPTAAPARQQLGAYVPSRTAATALAAPAAVGLGAPVDPREALLNTPGATSAAYMGFANEVGDLKRIVGDLVQQFRRQQCPDVPEALLDVYHALIQNQVDETLAREICCGLRASAEEKGTTAQLRDATSVRKLATTAVAERIRVTGPIAKTAKGRPHIISLIGPTGVGKTTTIAKLAANLKLREQKKVGLITIDTYRIAAIDQLKKYADIIGSPLAVVSHPDEIKDAVARMGDFDYVLIDTAGRSPKDAVKLKELQQFIAAAQPDEVHLVLSCVCGQASMELALSRFAGVRADKLVFTKLDEAAQLGPILNISAKLDKPVSYLTVGQDVPTDIETACPQRLASLILGAAL